VANCAVTRLSLWLFFCVIVLCLAASAHSQASYAAQIRGVVTDQTGTVVVNATVTITNNAAYISQVSPSDHHGQYFISLRGCVRPSRAGTQDNYPLGASFVSNGR
jgi:hypothetical protein